MITLTDTHCHLADKLFAAALPDIIRQAQTQGVCRFIVPSANSGDFAAVTRLAALPQVYPAFGIHPWFADTADETAFDMLAAQLERYPQAWVGETGLDFLHAADEAAKTVQQAVFRRHLDLAQQIGRRVIAHNVKSTAALTAAVKHCGFTQGGIVHAFSGSLEEARILVRLGFKIGIGSLLLNPNAKKAREAAQKLDLQDIVLETDSPFMLKNQINTPANLYRIAETVAALRGIPLAELAAATERNVDILLS
nr:TatD family hydrolase [Neisseria lisongii]